MSKRRLVIAAYDIVSARRLKRALKHCTQYATGGQKSVHECWVTEGERAALCAGLERICDPLDDVWLVADINLKPAVIALGRGRAPTRPPALLFVG